jgi:LysM repeat protein
VRYLAPMALVGFAVVVVAVVGGSSSGKRHVTPPAATVGAHHHRSHHRFYRVRRGDTLSRIALRTGIGVAAIETLNPRLDPHALRPGQRVKLRR